MSGTKIKPLAPFFTELSPIVDFPCLDNSFTIFGVDVHLGVAECHIHKSCPLFLCLHSYFTYLICLCAGHNFVISLPRFIICWIHVNLGVVECHVQKPCPSFRFFTELFPLLNFPLSEPWLCNYLPRFIIFLIHIYLYGSTLDLIFSNKPFSKSGVLVTFYLDHKSVWIWFN